MNFQTNNILLQMLMVLFPIIIYQALVNNRKLEKNEPFYWSFVFSITMVLCLTFAIKLDEGIMLDLRMVPWFLAYIYGGKSGGIFVSVFYVFIRFLIGGEGMIPAFTVILIGTIFIWGFRDRFIRWERKKKILHSILFLIFLSTLIPICGSLLIGESITGHRMIINLGFVAVNAVTVWLAVHLIESNKEKQELIKEMQKNEKLQVVGQVAASVAHEIRNPMTSVRGFIQMLSGSKNISTSEKNYLHICLDELDRANAIISDYLSLGRSYEMEGQRMIDVSELATRSVNTLISYSTIQNVNVTLESCNGAYILGNPSRLQQMFINLIKNAIEAAPSGGNVAVIVSSSKDLVQISVQDNGVGMSPSQIENIGLPYYSTKEKGTGLGLMVTLQIIKEMDGAWNVTSTLNKGTQFNITFPLRKQEDDSHTS